MNGTVDSLPKAALVWELVAPAEGVVVVEKINTYIYIY